MIKPFIIQKGKMLLFHDEIFDNDAQLLRSKKVLGPYNDA